MVIGSNTNEAGDLFRTERSEFGHVNHESDRNHLADTGDGLEQLTLFRPLRVSFNGVVQVFVYLFDLVIQRTDDRLDAALYKR
jgi:hypothetical protein